MAAPSIQVVVNTQGIIGKHLFDPERGAGRNKENHALALATQKIRCLALTGTAVLARVAMPFFSRQTRSTIFEPWFPRLALRRSVLR